jgi:hypothetical protein
LRDATSLDGNWITYCDIQATDIHGMRVAPREQGCPRGGAAGGVFESGKPDAVPGQRVDMRRFNLSSVTPEIGIPQVIGHDQNNVGLIRSICLVLSVSKRQARQD